MAEQGTPNQPGSAPEGTDTPWTPSPATLGDLYDLPPEMRTMIYQRALDLDNATPMVRSLVYRYSRPDLHLQSANLANLRPRSWALFIAIREALSEALRIGWTRLPTRLVTFPGANVAHPDRGLTNRPLEGQPLNNGRLLNPETTAFYVDQESLSMLAPMAATGQINPPDRYAWLTDLVLESRTFEDLSLLPRPPGSDRPQPLDALPGLRRLTVGFLRRWQDVVAVEGPQRDVIEEARVDIQYDPDENDGSAEPVVRRVDVRLEPSNSEIELMIFQTVWHTTRTVRALERAGVDVVWAFIRQGVTRRLDIEAGAGHARR
ncbi:hypothetical protein PG985_011672 [Apiospora marii]|uniref:Uncharacterized protein n=1 Tax=Apiospora marii TaxID=335849 RepID=A0ABR1R170_9PEZI